MSHSLTQSPARPAILCTLCQHNHARAVTATHYYQGREGRCYVCGPCQKQVARLALSFPRDFTAPAPLATTAAA